MREYSYYLYEEPDAYGQATQSTEIKGTIKLAIYPMSQALSENIKYKDCTYTALTKDAQINDTFVIQYKEEKLKVQYINHFDRYNQVYLQSV